jgi:ribonucleoside-diphosphate reductase alpha chain
LTEIAARAWDAVAWARRDLAVRDAGGAVVFEAAGVEAPVDWSDVAVATVAGRWMGADERSVRDMVRRVVETLGAWALVSGHVGSAARRREFEDALARLVLGQRATFATPVWMNAGTSERPITAACFILGVEDSLPALLEWNAREGRIFQQGAGAGVNLSAIRSSREPVSLGGRASGPVSFMRGADAWAASIRAGGRARRAAKMVVLDVDHPDILEFIGSKAAEETRGWALVAAGFDAAETAGGLAFQQENHSVRVTDAFMHAVRTGKDWPLHAITTGQTTATMPARDILHACAQAAWACGDPGLQFASTIDRWQTCPAAGPITASNPCGEFVSVADSACNLATINALAYVTEDGAYDVYGFTSAVDELVRALDVLVSGSGYPTPEVARTVQALRELGLGLTNVGAALLWQGIGYSSPEGRAWAAAVAALMTAVAYRRSAEMAAELGTFDAFDANRERMLMVLEQHHAALRRIPADVAPQAVVAAADAEWTRAIRLAHAHGLRNAQVTLIPPAGTVSLAMDCETTGLQPYYAFSVRKRLAEGGEITLRSRALEHGLLRLGYSARAARHLAEHAAGRGHLADALQLHPEHRPVVATAIGPNALAPAAHVAMVAAVQPFVSGGISTTVNLPEQATVDDVENVFVDAWSSGLKSVTVYRQGSKLTQPLTVGSA